MEEYLTTLRLDGVEDLKERVLGSAAFLACWPIYRDEYFWGDDRQVGTRGNNEPTISARVVAELELRNKSRYAYGGMAPTFRIDWTPLDYDIWLYSQLISMLGIPGQFLESRKVSERKIICEALTGVIRQIKYDYNPNRKGALARFIEKASPSELHEGKSRQILNTEKASLKPDAKRRKPKLAAHCGAKGGLVVPQHPSFNTVINSDTTADGANIRNNMDIDGVSGKEKLERLNELVNELPLATDPATDPAADPVADAVTDPATDPAIEPGAEPATEPVKKSQFPLDPPFTDAQIRKWVIELDAVKDEILSDVQKGLTTYLTNDYQAFYVENRRRFMYALGDRFTPEWALKYPEFLP